MFERFQSFHGIRIWRYIYISRTSSKRAQRVSVITSAVHSYLRSSYGGLPSIFYSSISSCSRDFIGCSRDFTLSTAISIWIYISRTWWNRSEAKRAQRASVITSAVHSYLRSSYGGLPSIFYSSISSCSRDFKRFMVLVFEYISLELRQSKRAQRVSVITSAVHSYLRSISTETSSSFILPFILDVRDISWYYDISIWIYLSKHRTWSERAERASV